MKIGNPRLVRLASLTRGAITERGDGEIIVPTLVQPVATLSSPLKILSNPAPITTDDSVGVQIDRTLNGVNGPATVQYLILTKGFWRFTVFGTLIFTGTTNANQSSGIQLTQPGSGAALKLLWVFHVNGQGFARDNIVLDLVTQDDSWDISFLNGNMVALDFLGFSGGVVVQRLL